MKTLKCPLCGAPLTLVDVLFRIERIGPFHYENRTVFYYACHNCQLAAEYGASEDEAWEKARRLIDRYLGSLNRKKGDS